MKLRYIILYVDDVAASLARYETAFGLERRMLHPSGDYGELDTGETRLAFSARRLMQSLGKSPSVPDASRPAFEIAFETDDVQATLQRAEGAGFTVVQAPREEPWGQTTAYVSDGEGFLVEICTPVTPPAS